MKEFQDIVDAVPLPEVLREHVLPGEDCALVLTHDKLVWITPIDSAFALEDLQAPEGSVQFFHGDKAALCSEYRFTRTLTIPRPLEDGVLAHEAAGLLSELAQQLISERIACDVFRFLRPMMEGRSLSVNPWQADMPMRQCNAVVRVYLYTLVFRGKLKS